MSVLPIVYQPDHNDRKLDTHTPVCTSKVFPLHVSLRDDFTLRTVPATKVHDCTNIYKTTAFVANYYFLHDESTKPRRVLEYDILIQTDFAVFDGVIGAHLEQYFNYKISDDKVPQKRNNTSKLQQSTSARKSMASFEMKW